MFGRIGLITYYFNDNRCFDCSDK